MNKIINAALRSYGTPFALWGASVLAGYPYAMHENAKRLEAQVRAQEVVQVRGDLIRAGDTDQDGVFDLHETKSLLDKLGYDRIVEPGTRIDVYSPESGEGSVYKSGDFVRVPLGRAKSVLEEMRGN